MRFFIVLYRFKLSSERIPTRHAVFLPFAYHFPNSGTNSSNSICFLKNGKGLFFSVITPRKSGYSRTHLSLLSMSQQVQNGWKTLTEFLKFSGRQTQYTSRYSALSKRISLIKFMVALYCPSKSRNSMPSFRFSRCSRI